MKIGILGTAHHYLKAPFGDQSWQIWGCNLGKPPRYDRWFEFHSDESIDTYPGHRERLAAETKPLYMRSSSETVPQAIPYPIDVMKEKYGDWFFSSTISYMLAMALEESPNEIGLWGVDMSDETEYAHQRPGCRFFLQLAKMRGIKLTIPEECDLLVPNRLYAYDQPSWLQMKATAKRTELVERAAQVTAQRQALLMEKIALQGARDITMSKEDIEKRLLQIPASEADLERVANVLDGGVQLADHILASWVGEHR